MALKEFEADKLYYGFPIFIIGYPDANTGVNITTCSSSYSLGDMLQFGLSSDSNAADQLTKFQRCSINLMSAADMELVELAGFRHAAPKLELSGVPYTTYDDIPVLTNARIAQLVTIYRVEQFGKYTNFTARIERRFAQEEMLTDNGIIQTAIEPVLYAGDQRKRVYRFVTAETAANGSYLRAARVKR